ncbi:phage adaptor protein [Aeromonas rivipollensis]
MATVTVVTILKRVNTLLVDPTFTRWPKQELLDYYNDATKAIVLVRPDAYTKNVEFSCVAGTKQVLPSDALRLIEVLRNANGKVVRFAPRKALDDSYPEWHSGKTAVTVDNYTYEERDPKTFYLHPGPAAAVKVDVIYSVAPQSKVLADVDNAQSPALADLDDIYINPIIDFMLYRCFSKDAEYTANSNRAAGHYNAFLQQLGEKTQADAGMEARQHAGFNRATGQ